jgi:Terminase large subunit, T4likevirus-type, N-terminal/Hint domain/LAGLIDADG-like domain
MSNEDTSQQVSRRQAIGILWNRGVLTWKLDRIQKELYDSYISSNAKTIVWSASRRSGKSFALCCIAIEKCMQKSNAIVKFIAPSQKHVKMIIRPLMKEILKDCPKEIRPDFKSVDNTFRFKNGSEIQLAGTDGGHADSLRGGNCDVAIVDEAGFCDDLKYIVRSILIPTTTTTKGKIILSSTPPKSPDHDFEFYRKEAEFRGNYIKKTIYDAIGDRITQEMVDDIISELGGEDSTDFQREYLCNSVTDEDSAVVPEFTEEVQKACIKEWPRPPYMDFYVGGDIGFKDLTVFLLAYYDFKAAKLIIEDEVVMSGRKMTTSYLAEQLKAKERIVFENKLTKDYQAPYLRVCDNNLIVINDLNALHNLSFLPTAKDDSAAALNNMRIMIKEGRVIINPRCTTLIFHLKNATWNKSRKSYERSPDAGHYDACFTPGMKVMTSFGAKNIEDIAQGDLVLTHKGNFKPVKALMSRDYSGPILKVKASGRETIHCTPDHKFWVSSLKRTTNKYLTGQLTETSVDWARADSLITSGSNKRIRSALNVPLISTYKTEPVKLSPEMCFLYGYYVAEGSLGGNGSQIAFAGHRREDKVLKLINEAIRLEYGYGNSGTSRRSLSRHKTGQFCPRTIKDFKISYGKTSNGRNILGSCKELYKELRKLGKSTTKHFPEFVYRLDPEQAFYMLSGYLFGDGHFSKTGIRANSVSKDIIYGVEILSLICGVSGNIHYCHRKDKYEGFGEKMKNDTFNISFTKEVSLAMLDKIEDIPLLRQTFEDKLSYPLILSNIKNTETTKKLVRNIITYEYSGPVYSMEVEDDHSYTINGASVKNCDALKYLVRNIQQNKNPYPANFGKGYGENWFSNAPESKTTKEMEKVSEWFKPRVKSLWQKRSNRR